MTQHRFLNDGVSPIPMGSTADYACVCGKRGTYEIIELHIADMALITAPSGHPEYIDDGDNFGGGDTKAHYLPNEPRKPAPTEEMPPLGRPDRPIRRATSPEPLPPPPETPKADCAICGIGLSICDLPEISAWSCGHWIRKRPRSIAESFQEMLRIAYQAGAASAATGEIFETWYQREVLQ
jgi:hypothetical protein